MFRIRRYFDLRAISEILGGICVVASDQLGIPPFVAGIILLVFAGGLVIAESQRSNIPRLTVSAPIAALGVTVLLWMTLSKPSDPTYGFAGVLFILMAIIHLLVLNSVKERIVSFAENLDNAGR